MKLDVGGFNPLLGASYGEIAADSRSMHKSQGFGVARSRGPIVEYFKTLAEADAAGGRARRSRCRESLDGVDFTLARFAGATRCAALVERAQRAVRSGAPARRRSRRCSSVDAALDGAARRRLARATSSARCAI